MSQTLAYLIGASAILSLLTMASDPAHSASRQGRDGYGAVTAESRYGNPSRTARVRRGQFGPEIDVGHNSWMHCEAGDCRETLRRHKIDFWETIREDGIGGGRD